MMYSIKFEFSSDSDRSCQDISIPREELDPKRDSVFMISIKTQPDFPLGLGAVSSAKLTVAANSVDGDGKGKDGHTHTHTHTHKHAYTQFKLTCTMGSVI